MLSLTGGMISGRGAFVAAVGAPVGLQPPHTVVRGLCEAIAMVCQGWEPEPADIGHPAYFC